MIAPLATGLVQLSVGDDPAANLPVTRALIADAAGQGARLILTPECTNLISADRDWRGKVLCNEAEDPTLKALRAQAAELGIWLLIGSLALKADDPAEPRLINRSFLIAPDGTIAARYDKIHMFDVTISETEAYAESKAYRPGARAVLAQGPAAIGMSVCYDLRFPQLYRALAQAGAQILTVPAAFNDTTGAAHWHVLLRARAIETGSFVFAAAQGGRHENGRETFGHSLIVAPWGEVIAEAGTEPGIIMAEIVPAKVDEARSRVPSLLHDKPFDLPKPVKEAS